MFGLGVPLTFVVLVLVAIISGIKILKEYERAVVSHPIFLLEAK